MSPLSGEMDTDLLEMSLSGEGDRPTFLPNLSLTGRRFFFGRRFFSFGGAPSLS